LSHDCDCCLGISASIVVVASVLFYVERMWRETEILLLGLNRRRLSTGPLCRRHRHNSSGGCYSARNMDTAQSAPIVASRSLYRIAKPNVELFPVHGLSFPGIFLISISPSKLRGAYRVVMRYLLHVSSSNAAETSHLLPHCRVPASLSSKLRPE
jgi:hypothetical protein